MTERELYVPPDTTAQIFWLKNRKTQYWRDRKDMAAVVDVDQSTIESIEEQVKKARFLSEYVEFTAEDATRAETEFLYKALLEPMLNDRNALEAVCKYCYQHCIIYNCTSSFCW